MNEPAFDDDWETEEENGGSDVWDTESNVLRVLKEKCSTCIFGPNRFVSAKTVRAMEEDTRKDGFGQIQCHHTLPQISGSTEVGAICKGWWDRNALEIPIFRLAVLEDVVKFVEEPPVRDGVNLLAAPTERDTGKCLEF